ncbi:MAG: Fic family protein, partial [Candidatus Methanomethylophilaceae archaeon]|nr:Fic family protein [Candidatus Methanomethylophilaceae archaeon]
APHPDFVPVFIEDLMQWVRTTDHHPLIVSCVFHHEFEYVHPLTDGNGRTGRLWQTLLLSKWNPVFEWLPVESAIRDRQTEYYEAIRNATDKGDTCVFIEFILEAIRDSLIEALGSADSGMETKVFHIIKEGRYTNATDVARMLGVSERTVRRAITSLKEKNAIKRDGSTKTGRWVVAETHVSE